MLELLIAASANHVEEMIKDMTLPHVAVPRGVPAQVDWRLKPRLAMGNNPGEWRAFIAWGQVYAADGTKNPPNVRVQIRALQAFILSKNTGKWTRVQFANRVEGAWYEESFADDKSKPSDARPEPDGTLSVTIDDGYNYHFWTNERISIDPADIGGVVTAVQARLILTDPKGPDNRKDARLMMSVGADYWQALDSKWDYWKTNADVGIGRFRMIGNDWSWHYMTSLDAAALRKNPPPAPSLK